MSTRVPFQSIRKMTCSYGAFTGRSIEKFSQPTKRRQNDPVIVVAGDGANRAEYIHDPVAIIDAITVTINIRENDAFIRELDGEWRRQLQDPTRAAALVIHSRNGEGQIVDAKVAKTCVIQNIRY